MGGITDSIMAALLVSLRLAPTLAFAQPFTLLRVPVLVRVLLAVGLALWLVDARPALTTDRLAGHGLVGLFFGELTVGISIALALQLAFAAILWAGNALDVQAGFGLAALADPTTHAEQPLASTVLVYAAAAVFFTTGAQYDLLALWAASLETLPVGYGMLAPDMAALGSYIAAVFGLALGLVGATMLALFLADLVIAFLARTLPQMNVLLLGFQVKAMVMLLTLPIAIALGAALFLRIVRLALAAPPTYWGVA
jgi:flagellar biosynthesis protein FliR